MTGMVAEKTVTAVTTGMAQVRSVEAAVTATVRMIIEATCMRRMCIQIMSI